MAKTDTSKLSAAYAARGKALRTAADATDQELIAKEKELQRDTTTALHDAYVQKIRAEYRQPQADRAAGITGGESINNQIGRENQYSAARTGLKLNRETEQQSLANQRKINRANLNAELADNQLSQESQMLEISQGDDDHKRQVYAQMLSTGYIPTDSAEAQEISRLFNVPLTSLKAYVDKINQK